MATTDMRMAIGALSALQASGVKLAVLHGERRLLTGDIGGGDTDIVVDRPARAVLAAARDALRQADLHPIVFCRYDMSGSASVFLVDPKACGGVHLDMLHDPQGDGRFGIRSDPLLTSASLIPVQGNPDLPVADSIQRLIYLWVKRCRKNDPHGVAELRRQAETVSVAEVFRASEALLGTGRGAEELLHGRSRYAHLISLKAEARARPSRIVRRLVRPMGSWIHCMRADERTAIALARRFGSVLERHAVLAAPPNFAWAWYWRRVQPLRLRPGLVVTWGSPPQHPAPDLLSWHEDLDALASATVAAMEHNTWANHVRSSAPFRGPAQCPAQ